MSWEGRAAARRHSDISAGSIPGTCAVDGTNITLHFGGAGTSAWGATGTLTDDSFTVKYNDIMQHSDFYDGVYMRER